MRLGGSPFDACGFCRLRDGTAHAGLDYQRKGESVGDPLEGVRTLSCAHCDEHFILTSIRDEDVVLLGVLAVHLLLRHPEHFTLPADPWSAEVLQHFQVASRDVK